MRGGRPSGSGAQVPKRGSASSCGPLASLHAAEQARAAVSRRRALSRTCCHSPRSASFVTSPPLLTLRIMPLIFLRPGGLGYGFDTTGRASREGLELLEVRPPAPLAPVLAGNRANFPDNAALARARSPCSRPCTRNHVCARPALPLTPARVGLPLGRCGSKRLLALLALAAALLTPRRRLAGLLARDLARNRRERAGRQVSRAAAGRCLQSMRGGGSRRGARKPPCKAGRFARCSAGALYAGGLGAHQQ